MDDGLPRRSEPSREMCVGISRDEPELEEEQARAPDGRPAAEPRQDLLREKRLDEEEQRRSEKGCELEREPNQAPNDTCPTREPQHGGNGENGGNGGLGEERVTLPSFAREDR